MSNFSFVKETLPEVYELGKKAESYLKQDKIPCALYCRMSLEVAVKWLFVNDPNLEQPYRPKGLGEFVFAPGFKQLLPHDVNDGVHFAMKVGNHAAHGGSHLKEYELIKALEAVFSFVKWVAHYYTDAEKHVHFDLGKVPNPKEKKLAEAKELAKRFKDHFQKELDDSRKRDQEKLDDALRRSEEEIAELKAKLEVTKTKNEAEVFESDFDPNEEQTRKLYIDFMLKEVGWKLNGVNDLEYPLRGMPTKSGEGFADYVLWGDNGKPLAVVEAKRSLRDAKEGKQQSKLYADCLEQMHGQRPILFYTNGFETYLWDDTQYPERRVYGFYTKKELETLIERRHQRASRLSAQMKVDKDIAGRPYQERAIKKVLEAFDNKQRRALLVMATGSGKTRTAVALVKCLTQGNWCKRILFLADRTSLVKQAMRKSFRPMLPNLSMVNLLEEEEDDNSRMVFSTYQTMINKIDAQKDDGTRAYGVGHFDLIIIDESHRSIYKKYGAIFDYFDASLLGLTATPLDKKDRNTFETFNLPNGQPTDIYSFKDAVDNGYLVPYQKKEVNLKFPSRGIKYADLNEDEKIQYEETFTDELTGEMPEEIKGEAVNRWLFNKDTVRKVLEDLMQDGLRVEGGDKLGKTIMFCRSHKHAQFVVETFDELFPSYAGHFCQLIDNQCKNPQALIDDFEKPQKMPQIAVSVDMMDTGIDVPDVLNLVFFKPVKSKSKFWQMIGRGTRLCENVFGPAQDKSQDKKNFRIFDYCKNFEFFEVNSEGFDGGMGETLSQKMFKCRARLAFYLQDGVYQSQPDALAVWEDSIHWLHEQITGIDSDSALVRKSRRSIETFSSKAELRDLDEVKLHALMKDLSHLPLPIQDEEEMKKRFDVRLYNLMISVIEKTQMQKSIIKGVIKTAEDLRKKANLPSVKKKLVILDMVVQRDFSKDVDVAKADYVRRELRDLMTLLEKGDTSQVIYYSDLDDEVTNPDSVFEDGENFGDEFLDYKERLKRYFLEHPELIAVWKLQNAQPLDEADLHQLEDVLYSSEVSDKESFEENANGKSLTAFIRSLMGMNREAIEKAFGDFLDENNFNSKQIDCINIIIKHYVENGFMDKAALQEQPFKGFAGGFMGLYGQDNAVKLVRIINDLNNQVG